MSKTSARLLNTAERRAFVLKLRLAGATYRVIAERAVKEFGIDRLPSGWDSRYACMDVRRELERLNRERTDATAALRRLELERLDRLLLALWPAAVQGDPPAIDRVIRIMERRSKLLGLDAPQRFQELPFDRSDFPDLKAEDILSEAKRILESGA